MLKIYGRNNSINVQKVMWVVGELGLPHERVDAGGAFGKVNEDWYLSMNPMGRVPVIDDNGFVLWESHTIVRYLCAKHSYDELYPDNIEVRAEAEKWMDWKLSFLQPAIHQAFWGLIRTPAEKRDTAVIEASAKETARLFTILDRHLERRDYIAANRVTIGDIPVGAMAYRWYGLDVKRPNLPAVKAWYDKLVSRPAFEDHVMLPIT